MGAFRLFSGSDPPYDKMYTPSSPNPNPNRFKIKKWHSTKYGTVLKVKYLDCTNYEGNKILLYKNVGYAELSEKSSLDPHFSIEKDSPFARFEPTSAGWEAAVSILNSWSV